MITIWQVALIYLVGGAVTMFVITLYSEPNMTTDIMDDIVIMFLVCIFWPLTWFAGVMFVVGYIALYLPYRFAVHCRKLTEVRDAE